MKAIEILKQDRALIARTLDGLSERALLFIPPGFKNNILWNVGHIIVTQQLLHYKLARLETYIPDELIRQCRTGTSPADWTTVPEMGALKAWLLELPQRLAEDYRNDRFAKYRSYTTSTGVRLEDIDDAISFNNFHEGVHTGVIMSLKKLAA